MSAIYIWALGITVLGVVVFLLWIGLRAQNRPNPIGNEAMIGETGVVRKTSGFRNRTVVEVRGENWWCRVESRPPVAPGDEVAVKGIDPDDMMLVVEPVGRG